MGLNTGTKGDHPLPTEKPAIQQVWKPALRGLGREQARVMDLTADGR